MCAQAIQADAQVQEYVKLLREKCAQCKSVYIKAAIGHAVQQCEALTAQAQAEADGTAAPPPPPPEPVVEEDPKKKGKKAAPPPPKPAAPKVVPAPVLQPNEYKITVTALPDKNMIKVTSNGIGYSKEEIQQLVTSMEAGDAALLEKLGAGNPDKSELQSADVGLLGVFAAVQKFDLVSKSYKEEKAVKLSYSGSAGASVATLARAKFEFGCELTLYFNEEDKDLLNTVQFQEYVKANVQVGEIQVDIPFVEVEKIKLRSFFTKEKPTDGLIKMFELGLDDFKEAVECYLGLLWPDQKAIKEVAFIRQFKGKSMKKGSFLTYINDNDLAKYKQLLIEIKGGKTMPTYGQYADELDEIMPLLEGNKHLLQNGQLEVDFESGKCENQETIDKFIALNGVAQENDVFPTADSIIKVLKDQCTYFGFYKKFDKLTCKTFVILYDAVEHFCKYFYAKQNALPFVSGLEPIYMKMVASKFGQDGFEKQFLQDLFAQVKVPQIGLKRGLLTKEPVFFEGTKELEEGMDTSKYNPEYMLTGEQLLVYCMALLTLSGYKLDKDSLNKKLEEKMMVFPGFVGKDKQSEIVKPVFVELKKEEE